MGELVALGQEDKIRPIDEELGSFAFLVDETYLVHPRQRKRSPGHAPGQPSTHRPATARIDLAAAEVE